MNASADQYWVDDEAAEQVEGEATARGEPWDRDKERERLRALKALQRKPPQPTPF